MKRKVCYANVTLYNVGCLLIIIQLLCVRLVLSDRSIQKLEELNVGMDNLGEEVKSLTQQYNGNGNTPAPENNNNPPSDTPELNRVGGGGVLSSTPQRPVGGRPVPLPDESPVVSQRYVFISVCIKNVSHLTFTLTFILVCAYSGQKLRGQQGDSPSSLTRSKEV